MPGNQADSDFMVEARERYSLARDAWQKIREEAETDLKFATGDQWKPEVRAARLEAGLPVLTFNRLHPLIQNITNRARQNRPQPKVNPLSADANAETAKVLEGLMRHIHYASQADIAYDCAIEYAAACGLGYYEITTEYVDERSFDQEPRIRRILDPMTIYFDPAAMEPDFSDAKWCFARLLIHKDDYEDRFGEPPTPFDDTEKPDATWFDENYIWVSRYWTVTEKKRKFVALADGRRGFANELGDYKKADIVNSRDISERTIDLYIIDGRRVLEHHEWPGKWIPVVPVLGAEKVIEGKRQFISLIRYARDAQKLFNAYKTQIAQVVGTANNSEYIGYKGQFKDKKWDDPRAHRYLETEPTMINGQIAPLPQKNVSEPPVQALSMAAMAEGDDIKAAIGYIDNLLAPSRTDLSGIAVQRRTQQADLVNYHFEDNLERSHYHCGRVLLDLIPKVMDAPRVVKIMSYDGSISEALITTQANGGQAVPEFADLMHNFIDVGAYGITVTSEPSYASKLEEEKDVLLQTIGANPQLFPAYADLYFKILGFPDLEERAQLMLPPEIQQAAAAKAQGIPSAVSAQMAQLTQQNQQLQQGIQQVLQILTTKQIETQGKLELEKAKGMRELAVAAFNAHHETNMAMQEHGADLNQAMLEARMKAIQRLTEMLHETQMNPQQPHQGYHAVAPPQPQVNALAVRRSQIPSPVQPMQPQYPPQQRPF